MRFKLYREHGALNSPNIFNAFEIGLKTLGHESVQADEDVAVIWSVLWNGRMAPNKAIYDQCRIKNKPIIIIEVGNLLRNQTWRICLNHINGLGEFGNDLELDFDRPKKLGVELKPIKTERNSSILIATQHHKSLQWKGQPPVSEWLNFTIEKIRSYTDRRIVIRPHPRAPIHLVTDPLIKIQHPIKLPDTYDKYDIDYNYHCVVNHNSGVSIQAGIAGVPICCGDNSLAAEISTPMLAIDTPLEMDRRPWFERILHTEWTVDEIKQGIPQRRIINDLT